MPECAQNLMIIGPVFISQEFCRDMSRYNDLQKKNWILE